MISLERKENGRVYRLTPYTVTEWYALCRAGCPLPSNIVDEYGRIWEAIPLKGNR